VPPTDGNLEAYDQASYGGGAAPFPRPVTQISGLDTLRSFILGQLEYYFSMQNLAMDFFLRQQVSPIDVHVENRRRDMSLILTRNDRLHRWTIKDGSISR
jgi:hypothetical protein